MSPIFTNVPVTPQNEFPALEQVIAEPNTRLVCRQRLRGCQQLHRLAKVYGESEAALGRLKTSYPNFPGITLDDIVKEEVFYEDPAILDRYRAILRAVEKEG